MTVPLLQQEGGDTSKRIGLAHPSISPYGVFKTRDGVDVLISIQNDREWRVLADTSGRQGARRRSEVRHQRRAHEAPRRDRRPRRRRFRHAGRRAADGEARAHDIAFARHQRHAICWPRIRICGASPSARRPARSALPAPAAQLGRRAAPLRRGARARRAYGDDQEGIREAKRPSRSPLRPASTSAAPGSRGADDHHQRDHRPASASSAA